MSRNSPVVASSSLTTLPRIIGRNIPRPTKTATPVTAQRRFSPSCAAASRALTSRRVPSVRTVRANAARNTMAAAGAVNALPPTRFT